jgi:AcrR family transcriptional regulator
VTRKKVIQSPGAAGRSQEKRLNAIARVGSQLFSTRGYVATSVDDIAAAARVTKGGIYHYFSSKAEILYFICSKYVDLDIEGLEQALDGIEAPEAKIRLVISRHIAHYCEHVSAARTVLSEAYNLPPRYRSKVKARERHYFELVREILSGSLLREILSVSRPRATDKSIATALALSLFGMMNWVHRWYDPKGEIKPEQMSELIYEIFMNGVNGRTSREIGSSPPGAPRVHTVAPGKTDGSG